MENQATAATPSLTPTNQLDVLTCKCGASGWEVVKHPTLPGTHQIVCKTCSASVIARVIFQRDKEKKNKIHWTEQER